MQRRKLLPGSAVCVEWADSKAYGGWIYDARRPLEVARIRSLGYVIQTRPDGLSISTSVTTEGDATDVLSIPWGAVRSLEVLPNDWSVGGPE